MGLRRPGREGLALLERSKRTDEETLLELESGSHVSTAIVHDNSGTVSSCMVLSHLEDPVLVLFSISSVLYKVGLVSGPGRSETTQEWLGVVIDPPTNLLHVRA